MAFFEWKPVFSVGIPTIDKQHRILIKSMNDFFASSMVDNVPLACESLHALMHYTHLHFQDEERMMTKNGYPEISAHKALHRDLVAEMARLAEDYSAQPSRGRASQLASFLRGWLMKHILGNDKKYSESMIAKGVK